MFHNRSSCEPSEVPMNMVNHVNISQIDETKNLNCNLQNLSKISQHLPQPSNMNYNLSNYTALSNQVRELGSQMVNFQHFSPFASNSAYSNINDQNPFGTSIKTHKSFIPEGHNTITHVSPLFQTKNVETIIQKAVNGTREHPMNCTIEESIQITKNMAPNIELDIESRLEKERRRESIENTVKIIENILCNTSKSKPSTLVNPKKSKKRDRVQIEPKEENNELKLKNVNDLVQKIDEKLQVQKMDIDKHDVKVEYDNPLILQENLNKNSDSLEYSDTKVKVEPLDWYNEDFLPFSKDISGIERESVNTDIIDAELSIGEATIAITNGTQKALCFTCPHCFILINHPKKFMIHVKWHMFGLTNEKRLAMTKEREARRNQIKEERIQMKVAAAEADGVSNRCKDCGMIFTSKNAVKLHRTKVHTGNAKECRICHQEVDGGWVSLHNHLQSHKSEGGYECIECGKQFKHAASLYKHADTHLEKTQACPQCPKKFGSVNLLNIHVKTHIKAERGHAFWCTFCGKGFMENYALKTHERTSHLKDKPFVCDICQAAFGTKSGMLRHIKVSHNQEKPFECPTCHRCFSTERHRYYHEARLHGSPSDLKFECELCHSRYHSQKHLTQHKTKTHRLKPPATSSTSARNDSD